MESVYKRLLYVIDKLFSYVISKSDHDLINGCDVKSVKKQNAISKSFWERNSEKELNISGYVTVGRNTLHKALQIYFYAGKFTLAFRN